MIGDPVTLTFYYTDDLCNEIYRGSVVGVHALQLQVNKYLRVLHMNQHWAMFTSGDTHESWFRTVEYRRDGTIMVVLNHNLVKYVAGEELYVCKVQDVTEAFQHHL